MRARAGTQMGKFAATQFPLLLKHARDFPLSSREKETSVSHPFIHFQQHGSSDIQFPESSRVEK